MNNNNLLKSTIGMTDSTEVYCIDDEDGVETTNNNNTSKIGDKRKVAATFDEPIDLTEEEYLPQKVFNSNNHEKDGDDDDDDDQIQVIIPLHTLLNRFRESINALMAPSGSSSSSTVAVSQQQFHSASQGKKKAASKNAANNYGFGFGFGFGGNQVPATSSSSSSSSVAWGAGVGYGGNAQTGLLSASKSVQQAQKKLSQEDTRAMLAFRGLHFCFTANEGVVSEPLLNEVSKHRLQLLSHLDRRLKNDSLMDIAGRKELYLAVLDTLQSVIDNDSLVTLFSNPPASQEAPAASLSLLDRLKKAISVAPTSEPSQQSEPSLQSCHQWLGQLQKQATT